MNIYKENGYRNRKEYLDSLAEEFEIPAENVYALSTVMGESEDFDGLVTSLEDYYG